MENIIVDEEFRCLLPTLDAETYRLLEENIINNGCRDPLVLWEGKLIDGFHRHAICTKHDIAYNTISKEFNSREEVLIWIVTNQVSRRNLTPIQLSYCRGMHYIADKKLITNKNGNNQYSETGEAGGQIDHQAGSTASRLANYYNISPKTVRRDSNLANAINAIGVQSPEARRKVLSGEVKIDKKKLQELSSDQNTEIEELSIRIEEGTYNRRPAITPTIYGPDDTDDLALSEIREFDAAVKKAINEFLSELKKLGAGDGLLERKAALKSHIDKLDGMYESYSL